MHIRFEALSTAARRPTFIDLASTHRSAELNPMNIPGIKPHRMPGYLAATFLWMIGSGLFSLYANKFASHDKMYGALGALLVLLIWLWLSAFVVLLGAEINGEAERQTRRKTSSADV